MTVTATGTLSLADSASARSAIPLAMVSRSVIMCFLSEREIGRFRASALALEPQLSHVESESILRVSAGLEPLLQESFDSFLRRGSVDGGHAGVPARLHFDVRRQAGFVDEALGVGDRPPVERGDSRCEPVDEIVQLGVG